MPRSFVLKVPHHGSRTSTGSRLREHGRAGPSFGGVAQSFGHPHPEVARALRRCGGARPPDRPGRDGPRPHRRPALWVARRRRARSAECLRGLRLVVRSRAYARCGGHDRGAQVLHRQGPTPLHARRPYPRVRRAGSPEAASERPRAPEGRSGCGAGERDRWPGAPVDFGQFLLSLGAQAGMLLRRGPVRRAGRRRGPRGGPLRDRRSWRCSRTRPRAAARAPRRPGAGRPALRAADGLRGPSAGGRRLRRAARSSAWVPGRRPGRLGPHAGPAAERPPRRGRPGRDRGHLRRALRVLRQGRPRGDVDGARRAFQEIRALRIERNVPNLDEIALALVAQGKQKLDKGRARRRGGAASQRLEPRAEPARRAPRPGPAQMKRGPSGSCPRTKQHHRGLSGPRVHRPRPLPRGDPARSRAFLAVFVARRIFATAILFRLGPLLRHDLEEALGPGAAAASLSPCTCSCSSCPWPRSRAGAGSSPGGWPSSSCT